MQHIFITGATGNIGSKLVNILKNDGVEFSQSVSDKNQENIQENKVFVDFGNKTQCVLHFVRSILFFFSFQW